MFKFDTQLLLQAFGLIFIGLGLAARIGFWKKWYWQTRGAAYGYIPLGCMFLFYSFNEPLKKVFGANDWLFPVIFALFLAIAVWWAARTPRFMKPRWVHWIEKYPVQITEAMKNTTKDNSVWERHVTSEAAVDAWAKMLGGARGKKAAGKSK